MYIDVFLLLLAYHPLYYWIHINTISPHQFSYLVLISLVSLSHGIRVHWNTNEGPIVPATSTVPPVPKPPFRDPAPVWEIQSNDIENPNPFVYVTIAD